jgi:TonB family protein
MERRTSTRPHLFAICAAMLLHACVAARVHAADAPSGSIKGNTPLSGCKLPSPKDDSYPRAAKLRSISGRALALIERSPEGRVKVLRIEISNPYGVFDESVRRILTSFRCEPIEVARQLRMSVAFSMSPGPEFPHFDGADDQISVRGERLPPGVR